MGAEIDAVTYLPGAPVPTGTIDLALGYPDLDLFPSAALEDAQRRLASSPASALGYGPPAGNPHLVDALHRTVLANEVGAGTTLITNGAMEAVTHVVTSLVPRGGVMLVQLPTFPGLLQLATAMDIELVPVSGDAEGMDPSSLEAACRRQARGGRPADVVYLMPTFANPTGVMTSATRRAELATTIDRSRLLVIEDDAYRDISWGGVETATLHQLLPERVIHIRSLSKTLGAPGLRLAAVVAPAPIVADLVALRPLGGTNPYASELTAHLLDGLDYPAHLARLRTAYADRCQILHRAVAHRLPELDAPTPGGGFFSWIPADPWSTADLHLAARRSGVRFLTGEAFGLTPDAPPHLRLCFSHEAPGRLVDGVRALASALHASPGGGAHLGRDRR